MAALFLGCNSGTPADDASGDLPKECVEFVTRYEQYLAAASSGAGEIARARARQTRLALIDAAQRDSSEQMAARCRDGLRTLPSATK